MWPPVRLPWQRSVEISLREPVFRVRARPASGAIGSGFLDSRRNAVPGEGGSCVRPEDVGFYKLYEDIREGIPFRSVLGEDFPLIRGSSEFLCAKGP